MNSNYYVRILFVSIESNQNIALCSIGTPERTRLILSNKWLLRKCLNFWLNILTDDQTCNFIKFLSQFLYPINH